MLRSRRIWFFLFSTVVFIASIAIYMRNRIPAANATANATLQRIKQAPVRMTENPAKTP
jgi:hypothetical protein